MASVVLDSSALLAYIKAEPGAEVVKESIGDAVISAVNFAEAVSKLVDRGGTLNEARIVLGFAPVDIVDFDHRLAERAGALILKTRRKGLSLGDRACLALAERERLPVLTGDKAWAQLDLPIEVRLIR